MPFDVLSPDLVAASSLANCWGIHLHFPVHCLPTANNPTAGIIVAASSRICHRHHSIINRLPDASNLTTARFCYHFFKICLHFTIQSSRCQQSYHWQIGTACIPSSIVQLPTISPLASPWVKSMGCTHGCSPLIDLQKNDNWMNAIEIKLSEHYPWIISNMQKHNANIKYRCRKKT